MMKEAITWQKQKQWKIENQMKLNDKFLGFLLSAFLNVFPFCTVYYMFLALKASGVSSSTMSGGSRLQSLIVLVCCFKVL
jgi:Ca2+/Na+ antiporter